MDHPGRDSVTFQCVKAVKHTHRNILGSHVVFKEHIAMGTIKSILKLY